MVTNAPTHTPNQDYPTYDRVLVRMAQRRGKLFYLLATLVNTATGQRDAECLLRLAQSGDLKNKLSTEWYSRVRYRQPPILEPRPITESTFSQEKVFKNLSGDDSRILSGVVGKQSKDRFLTCTIIGFRARECLYVEPLGSCGVYENEARFLLLDSTSQILSLRDDDELPFTDLPVARDILVYDLERIANVQNPDVMSLINDKPVWRVKSYDLVETSPFTKSVVFVEQLHPTEHAVTVNGPWFTEPEYLHMASYEMPPLHSFLDGLVYASEYKTEAHLLRGALIYVKLPADSVRKVGCACCAVRTRTCYVSLPIRLNDEEVVQSEATVYDAYKMTLTEYLRETYLGNPPAPTHQVRTKKDKCKKNVVKCDQKEKKPVEQNQPSSSQVMTKLKKKRKPRMRRHHYEDRGGLNRTHSLELADVETAGETVCKQAVQVVNNIPMEVGNNSQTEVVKPDPVECSLCTTDIQPMDEVYFKVCCLEDCRLFVHKKCMQESLAAQGLRKKREYKDGICPTEGCSARIQNIFEYCIKNEESLYLKCAEKPEKKVTDILPKKDKKKEKNVKTKDTTVDSNLVTGSPEVNEESETVAVDVPPSSAQPEVAPAEPDMSPSSKPHRSIPLPVDIDNVVPLEKEKDPLEVKYAVAEQQQQKKTKAPKKKKGVLDIEFGIRREQKRLGCDQLTAQHSQLDGKKTRTASSNADFSRLTDDMKKLFNESADRNDVSGPPFSCQPCPRSASLSSGTEFTDNGFSEGIQSVVSNEFHLLGDNLQQMDDIVASIDSCLQDLVLNMPSSDAVPNMPISQLKDALLLVAGERVNSRQKTYIEKMFCGASTDPDSLRIFVSKLKYFSVSRMENTIVCCKNRAGRQLEEEQKSLLIDRPNVRDGEATRCEPSIDLRKGSYSPQTEQTTRPSYDEVVRQREVARAEAEVYRVRCMRYDEDAALTVCKSSREHVAVIIDSLFVQEDASLLPVLTALLDTKAKWIDLENVHMERKRLIELGELNYLPALPPIPILPDVVWDFFQKSVAHKDDSRQNNALQTNPSKDAPSGLSFVSSPNFGSMSSFASNGIGRSAWEKRNGLHCRHVDLSLHECKICLELIGSEKGGAVLSCPECVEPYHSQCVRGWLSTNSTCPQCRRIWPDPVDFPGLGQ